MTKDLSRRIAAMDSKQPFVWRLGITSAEFAALEAAVAAKTATARETLVYLAEWYRRRYDGSASPAKAVELTSAEIESLWHQAGFDESCAYRYEKKDGVAWEYSTFVLGGLAVRFETGRKDRAFFRQLCRLYYGEDVALDDVADQGGRSVAFRASIARHQSLYHFIRAILGDELAGDDALSNALVQMIKTANDDVLRDKFALEWLVRHQPGDEDMRRSLRLALKPEEIGGTCHSYVRYERVLAWGGVDQRPVRIADRFLQQVAELEHGDACEMPVKRTQFDPVLNGRRRDPDVVNRDRTSDRLQRLIDLGIEHGRSRRHRQFGNAVL